MNIVEKNDRKMASLRHISQIVPIEGADAIELLCVDGWQVVAKKGVHCPGELVVFCEVDSWVPDSVAPFLTKPGHSPKEFNGIPGQRLKTIKLRGELSQGLVLPFSVLNVTQDGVTYESLADEDTDVTELLGIQKWEQEIPAQLRGKMKGNFPAEIPKTDQPRIQNIMHHVEKWGFDGLEFEITEKLEGSSCTFYLDSEGVFHVCSRNIDLLPTEENSYWQMAWKYDIEKKMREQNLLGVALQGEMIGPGIQGNIYNLSQVEFHLFDVYSTTEGYFDRYQRVSVAEQLEINHAPVIATRFVVDRSLVEFLALAEIHSALGSKPRAEGVVFKCLTDPIKTFKVLSNQYLLSQK